MSISSHQLRVLCFGHDPILLDTRRMVLEASYDVVCIQFLRELGGLPAEMDFNLVLLCHTLTHTECDFTSHLARQRWPRAKVLSVASSRFACPEASVDEVIYGLDGPTVLLQTIDGMLHPAA